MLKRSKTDTVKARKKEIERLTKRILERMGELGDEDVMRYHEDHEIAVSI